MSELYIYHSSVKDQATVPDGGILSRTLQNDGRSKVIQFTFAPGTELTAHTAPMPATIYIASGEADVQLGADQVAAQEGTFIYMTPQLEHGIKAKTTVVMLLTMIKGVEKG